MHEILGLLELKLGDHEKAKFHLMAAEEICEKYLQGLGSADLKEKNSKDVLRTSVARINSWIEKDYIHIRNLDDDVVIYISELTKKYGELNELPMKICAIPARI